MTRRIEKAVVLGAGTMGARIAAHFANAGLPCILLDIGPPGLPADAPASERNKIVRAGLDAAEKSRPAAFYTAALAEKVKGLLAHGDCFVYFKHEETAEGALYAEGLRAALQQRC